MQSIIRLRKKLAFLLPSILLLAFIIGPPLEISAVSNKAIAQQATSPGHGQGNGGGGGQQGGGPAADTCGKGDSALETKFNFGCTGQVDSPIIDLMLALIKFLTLGVGIVVAAAIIMAGIKYSTSEGNPEATMQAKNNIQSALVALLLYIFAFALIQYLVPGGVFL